MRRFSNFACFSLVLWRGAINIKVILMEELFLADQSPIIIDAIKTYIQLIIGMNYSLIFFDLELFLTATSMDELCQ